VVIDTTEYGHQGLVRAMIADRFGQLLTEVVGDVGPVSWVLNGVGRASLTLSLRDPKCREEYLQIGNRLLLLFDNGLPPWGGVLDLPRTWQSGTVTVSAYGIERLLEFRCTGKNDSFYERPVGHIFQELLRREETQDPMGIRMGEVWQGGRPHFPRYHYKSLWYVLDYSLRRMERCDYRFLPYLENEMLRFQANFYQVAGNDRSARVALLEGRNIAADLQLTEQGQVINSHYAVAEGQTWGTERTVVVGQDTRSIARYGLRETGAVYAGVSAPATLEMHTRNVLRINSEPRRIFNLEVTNDAPGVFGDYDLGDTVRCVLPSYGFGGYDGTLRILAREFDPQTGRCSLVVEEPREPEYWIFMDEPGGETSE
jgi:hypothetical protein